MELSIIGLLAVAYVADLVTATVPMLVLLVQNGVSSGLLTPIISVFDHPWIYFNSGKHDLWNRNKMCQCSRASYEI